MRVLFERNDSDLVESGQIRAVLDALPIPISFCSSSDERIRYFNKAFVQTFGYPDGSFTTIQHWLSHAYRSQRELDEIASTRASSWNGPRQGFTEVVPIECTILCADATMKTTLVRETVMWGTGIGFATFEDISHRKHAERTMRQAMLQDPLTGLGNRRGLSEHWNGTAPARAGSPLPTAVLMLDLDRFKPVNDRFGHDTGDAVLQAVARRIRAAVRDCDFVARTGGDEFVIVLSGVAAPLGIEAICDRIVRLLRKPFWSRGLSVKIDVSIGVSLCPRDGHDLKSLLHAADLALYRRKHDRAGGWEWCGAA